MEKFQVVSALQGTADSEQCNITEDIASATSGSRIMSDIDGSQVTLQGIVDSKQCYMTEDFPPQVELNSTFVEGISDSQGKKEENSYPIQKVEQIESISFQEESTLRIKVENNHFYMIGQKNSDELSQIDEHIQRRPQSLDSGKMILSQHMMDQPSHFKEIMFKEIMKRNHNENGISTQEIGINHIIDQDQDEEKSFVQMKRGLRPVPISGMIVQTQIQNSFIENSHDEHQDDIILEKSKSSACSICKSKRPKVSRMKEFTHDELLEATKGFSVENSLSESEDGPTFKGLLPSKVKIVVKKYQITKSQEEKIFKSEIQLFANVRHKNVVMLLGLCTDKSQLMIVYEHVCNGSLDHYLSRKD